MAERERRTVDPVLLAPGFTGQIEGAMLWFAAVLLLLATLVYVALVRTAAVASGIGVIVARESRVAKDLSLRPTSPRRQDLSPIQRTIPAGIVFTIRLDDAGDIRYFMAGLAADAFEIGQRVQVEYETRGIPSLWSKRFVRSMQPAGDGRSAPGIPD